jgi:predicted N-acetyltransferase YhbS
LAEEVELMTTEVFNQIINLDSICFKRENNKRSVDNIVALYQNNPNGCFVVYEQNKVVAYVFARTRGNLGYIGPIGVHPEAQGRQYAKKLLEAGIQQLKQLGCTAIGLETSPESGKNIGLYQKIGFEPTYPTVIYKREKQNSQVDVKNIIAGNQISHASLLEFDQKFIKQYEGYSMLKEIETALDYKCESIYFYTVDNVIYGYLYYIPQLYSYVSSAFLKSNFDMKYFLDLYTYAENKCPSEELKIRINSRYKLVAQMWQYGFQTERSFFRMLYKDFEGIFDDKDYRGFVARSWIG